MNPKLKISQYFDSLIKLNNIQIKEQFEKSNENDLITNKPFEIKLFNVPYL